MNNQTWSVDLPGWHSKPDPDIAGEVIWVHANHDGEPDIALLIVEEGDNRVSVLRDPLIFANEVDGEWLATFHSWDAALKFALTHLEDND